MKRLLVCLMVCVVLCTSVGCQHTERRKTTMQLNILSSRFEGLVEKGETTREQEQAYIKVVSELSLQLDRSVRGTDAANQTRQNTIILSKTGVDPSTPLKLKPKAK